MKKIRIISRKSPLAMAQANIVKAQLQTIHSDLDVEIIGVTTKGDEILDQALDKIGGKGLFIKELEIALQNNKADLAVHSLKDLPANLLPGFSLVAVLKREDARDAFVSNKYDSLDDMPNGSVIGTSSSRRVALLYKYYPHLKVQLLRGNVQTRLKKLDAGEYDGIILAVAGLKRLNLCGRIKQILSSDIFIPSIGQGALGIEILSSRFDLIELLKALNDSDTEMLVKCERIMGQRLQASCNIPIAGHAILLEGNIYLQAMLADKDENHYCMAKCSGAKDDYIQIASKCADELIKQGASDIVAKYF